MEVLISLMQKHNVEWLIHTSDVWAIIGDHDAQAPTEHGTSQRPTNFQFGPYAESKFEGELLARRANGTQLENGTIH